MSEVESYFGPLEENGETNYIPPDYSDESVEIENSNDDEFDDDPTQEDEGALDSIVDEKETNKEDTRKEMISTPFSDTGSSPWGGNSGNIGSSPWSQQNSGSSIWQQSKPSWGSNPSWGSSFGTGTTGNQKQEIPRSKKVIFCDFLDCLMETYQSNGLPGLRPRDIYDLKPRFNVWEKLSAFNPSQIYALIPPNIISTTNGSDGWNITLTYWCCCLSAFLNIPYTSCKILSQTVIGQPKHYAILETLKMSQISRVDCVYVGIYSGVSGQSDKDIVAARACEIDYIDLNTLLNNMI